MRTSLKNARKHSASSQRWLERQLNDPYVAAAKREGMRSRAAYKLKEIDARHHLLKAGQRVVDLGGGKKYLNVTRLETIQIKKDGNSVVWTFDTLGQPSFSLARVIPWASGVTVYVEDSPTYRGV